MPDNLRQLLRQASLVVLGALLAAFFSAIVLFTEVRENLATYGAEINANNEQIDRLWDHLKVCQDASNTGD